MTLIRSELYDLLAGLHSSVSTSDLHHHIEAYIEETYPAIDYSKLQLEVISYKERDDDRYYYVRDLIFDEQEFKIHYPELYI